MIQITSPKLVIGVALVLAGCAGGNDKKSSQEPVKGANESAAEEAPKMVPKKSLPN